MQKTQKPLMLAYIIFLFVSIIYYAVSSIVGFEFQEWQRVVVAATISSYAFSVSSGYKFIVRSKNNLLNFLKERLELLKQLHIKESVIFIGEENNEQLNKEKEELLKLNQESIKNVTDAISNREKSIQKNTKTAFCYDVIGYLLFFCIFAFQPVYNFFKSSQETYTLFAFIMILIVEYVESTYTVKFEENYKQLNTQIKETLNKVEKYAVLIGK